MFTILIFPINFPKAFSQIYLTMEYSETIIFKYYLNLFVDRRDAILGINVVDQVL